MVPVTTDSLHIAFGLNGDAAWGGSVRMCSEDVQSRLLDNLLAWMGEDLLLSWWKTLQGTICTTVAGESGMQG